MINMKPGATQSMQSYVDGLPSVIDAHADYTTVTSDHLPILATVPLKGVKDLKAVKILSWNVLEKDGGNGFSKNGFQTYFAPEQNPELQAGLDKLAQLREEARDLLETFGENAPELNNLKKVSRSQEDVIEAERHRRIANALAKAVAENQPDFITLQEISFSNQKDSLYQEIVQKVIHPYVPVRDSENNVVAQNDAITFYNTLKFRAVVNSDDQFKTNFDILGNVTKFTVLQNTEVEIRLANLHHTFKEVITQHEDNIRMLLSAKDQYTPRRDDTKETLSIVVGDFNGTVAPIHRKKQNITTSVSASCFRKDEPNVAKAIRDGLEAQGAWAIDGCFYAHHNKNRETAPLYQEELVALHQANTFLIDPSSGRIQKPELKKNLNAFQASVMNELRMAISIDPSHQHKKFTNALSKILPNSIVKNAVNLNNEQGVCVMIDAENKALYQYFLTLKNPKFVTQVKDDANGMPCYLIFSHERDCDLLLKQINFAVDHVRWIKLAHNICLLKASSDKLKNTLVETGKRELSEIARLENIDFDKLNKAKEIIENAAKEKDIQDLVIFINEQMSAMVSSNSKAIDEPPFLKMAKGRMFLMANAAKTSDALQTQFETLFATLHDSSNDKAVNEIVVDYFTGLTNGMVESDLRPSVDDIDEFSKKLNEKLAEKKPNAKLRAAIGGVIGALVGLAVGVAIGVGLTWYFGGVGAIPTALLGAAKGFTAGTALATGTLTLGGITGAGLGLFSAYKRNQVHTRITTEVSNTFNRIKNF